jgi:hypothetical protein
MFSKTEYSLIEAGQRTFMFVSLFTEDVLKKLLEETNAHGGEVSETRRSEAKAMRTSSS